MPIVETSLEIRTFLYYK